MRLASTGLVVTLFALAGCKGELNPSYCALHRDDPDCLTTGVELLDAPQGPECTSDPDCINHIAGAVCDVVGGRCVECVDSVSCPSMQVCGADQQCHGCTTDADCASNVCLPTQDCAAAQDVLYATAVGSGTSCSTTEPCTLTTAVTQLTPQRHIIKLLPVVQDVTDPPITISVGFGVQIIANGVTYVADSDGPAITASGANLEILGLTIENADAEAVLCTNGVLSLRDVTIVNADRGVRADNCNLAVRRSRISACPLGAIYAGTGTHDIRNNILFNNGDAEELTTGAIHIAGATGGSVMFNTIVRTASQQGGGGRIGGIRCTEATDGAFAVAQNIIADWGDANDPIGPDTNDRCVFRDNYAAQNAADVRFTPDYHLTDASPLGAVRDANTPAMQADCTSQPNVYIDDIDGQARPFNNFCDRGADEYRP